MWQVSDLALHVDDCAIINRMKRLRVGLVVAGIFFGALACQLKEEKTTTAVGETPQIPPPRDVAAPPADALRTPSGIASKVLIVGLGSIRPKPESTVTVHYTGWTTDGKTFDSSYPRRQPAEFPLTMVIPGWTEAVQLMVVGEKRRFWIPGHLAYDGQPDKPQGMLCFEIELLDIR